MVRQARNYLVGALSGVTLIGIAIAAFVVIVSAQVFHEWPIADTGAHAEKSKVAPAKALGAPVTGEATAAAGTDRALRANRGAKVGRTNRGDRKQAVGDGLGTAPDRTGPATVVESAPTTSAGGDESSSSGGNSGSQPASPSPSSSGSPSGSTAGGTGNSGGSTETGSTSGNSTGSSGAAGGLTGSTGGKTIETPVTAAAPPSVAGTVNETVHGVDEAALGGTLEKTGVTGATEGAVNGVAGPESVVGQTVEGVGGAVGGLLGGKSSSGE